MAMTYTVIGPVVKRVTRNINKPPKDPKPQKGGASPFENAIEALSPLAWYRFREPNFTTRVKDSTANGYHLTKQLAAATRSAVKTRTTHPGGAYFPAVTLDNWATQGTFYKGVSGLLSGATEYTMLISFRMIAAPSAYIEKLFGIGTENTGESGDNDLVFMRASNNAPVNPHYFKNRTTTGLTPVNFTVTELLQDGVNRLAIVRFKSSSSLFRLTSSKPGHEALVEQSLSSGALNTLSRALILNARSDANTGSSTTTGTVIDQIAIFSTDIGAVAEADLHSKWSDEVAGAGYYPSMMQFDGSTGYYSRTYTSSGNLVTGIARFNQASFSGAGNKRIFNLFGPTHNRLTFIIRSNDHANASERNKLVVSSSNNAGTQILRLFSLEDAADSADHIVHFAWNSGTGAFVFKMDGDDADDSGQANRLVTTGTLDSGASSSFSVGASTAPADFFSGKIGHIGIREAYLTNWSDFMDGNLPKAVDEKNWAEWGAQPLFWSHTGEMTNNKGSAGHMTKNGTITMTVGGSP